MQSFPNGTTFSVSTAFSAAVPFTAVTNAAPPVCSAAAPPTDGTVGLITSGWAALNERVAKTTGMVASTSFELEGIDTTDTTKYPAGQGAGDFTPVSTWVQLSQVTNVQKSGGTQQFYKWQYAEDPSSTQKQRPTFKDAKTLTLTLDYDPALAWYDALSKADAAQSIVILKAVLPSGDTLYYAVYPSFDADPSMDLNKNMENTATFSLVSPLTRYAAGA
ncbi:MAG TPA: phage tail protein [Rhodanobacteraceae bacterium]|nr:phage tail protein [Rhodanobacteraceae bacterium]